MGPGEIFGAIKGATDATKAMLAIKEIASSAEAKLALATVQLSLADAKEAAAALKEENSRLKRLIKQKNKDKIEMIRRNDIFFHKKEELYKCPTCHEKDEKIMTLHSMSSNSWTLKCKKCSNEYLNPEFDEALYKRNSEQAAVEKRDAIQKIGRSLNKPSSNGGWMRG
jgi:Zn finger protein HypA/HybF involved in hydrogenase expression